MNSKRILRLLSWCNFQTKYMRGRSHIPTNGLNAFSSKDINTIGHCFEAELAESTECYLSTSRTANEISAPTYSLRNYNIEMWKNPVILDFEEYSSDPSIGVAGSLSFRVEFLDGFDHLWEGRQSKLVVEYLHNCKVVRLIFNQGGWLI